jgi:hypothetical protein
MLLYTECRTPVLVELVFTRRHERRSTKRKVRELRVVCQVDVNRTVYGTSTNKHTMSGSGDGLCITHEPIASHRAHEDGGVESTRGMMWNQHS